MSRRQDSESGWQTVRGKKPTNTKQNTPTPESKKDGQSTNGKQLALGAATSRMAPLARSKPNVSPKKQNWTNSSGALIDAKPRHPPPNLLIDIGNDAELAWRKHEEPKARIGIPHELALQDDHYKMIAQQNGTFIDGSERQDRSGRVQFELWGDEGAVNATKHAIEAWIGEWKNATGTKSHLSAKFPKVLSLTDKQRQRKEKEWESEVRKQKYRQNPPPCSIFQAIGTFHWPAQDYRPEEILGLSHEALDPIRMDCECYVIYKTELSAFQVSGRAKDVQQGLLRLRKTCFQIGARSMAPVRVYMLHWPDATVLPSHVILKAYELPKAPSNEPVKVGNLPTGTGKLDDEMLLGEQTATSERKAKILLMQTLKKLHYYRGSIQLRVRLGTFLAVQFRKPKEDGYELDEYDSMIKESQFIGRVTEELGDRTKELAALDVIQGSKGMFQPGDHISESLVAVRPLYSVLFTFADEAGDLCLAISWKETRDEGATAISFEQSSKKWTRLERDTGAAVPLLDISLCDLNTGMAWQFDVVASQAVDEARLSNALINFERSVEINPKAALKEIDDNHSFVTYKPYAVKLKQMRQSLSYQYDILTEEGCLTDYTLDLTRFQDRSFGSSTTLYESRWSLNVLRSEWNVFAQNESLKIGERADWKDDIDTWCPEDSRRGSDGNEGGRGFEDLMENLKRIGSLVRDVKQGDLLGDMIDGMTVG